MSDWIKLHSSVFTHPKTRRLVKRLGVGQAAAVGHLAALWTWTMEYAPDGDLSRFDAEEIEIAACWDGEDGAFITAAIAAGYLDRGEGDGALSVHDWADYGGKLAAQRAAERKRWSQRSAQRRASGGEASEETPANDDPPASLRSDSGGAPAVQTRSALAREDRQTEETEETEESYEDLQAKNACRSSGEPELLQACPVRKLEPSPDLSEAAEAAFGSNGGAVYNRRADKHRVAKAVAAAVCHEAQIRGGCLDCKARLPFCRRALTGVLAAAAGREKPAAWLRTVANGGEVMPEAIAEELSAADKDAQRGLGNALLRLVEATRPPYGEAIL